ncbi:MAG: PIN domain-containing protein [Spirochaetaceae bacterium]|nr:PIN domain-containing protein [Spirochaetaceae bacterium]
MRSFFDSNVLAYTDDAGDSVRQAQALALYEECHRRGEAVISLQVLQEYFVTVTRKLGVDPALARRKVEVFAKMDVVVPQVDDILSAIDLVRLHSVSFWDALIVRAAQVAQCSRLYSEDMNHGWRIDGLEIANPFVS